MDKISTLTTMPCHARGGYVCRMLAILEALIALKRLDREEAKDA
jgi:hypothetical protein